MIIVVGDDREAAAMNGYLASGDWASWRELVPPSPAIVASTPDEVSAAISQYSGEAVGTVTLLPWSLDGDPAALQARLSGWRSEYPGLELYIGATPKTGLLLTETIWRNQEAVQPQAFAEYREVIAAPQEIEDRSMALIDGLLGETSFTSEQRVVVKRLVHTAGDPWLAQAIDFHSAAVASCRHAIRQGTDIHTDTSMVKAGINRRLTERFGGTVSAALEQQGLAPVARRRGLTRSRVAFEMLGDKLNGAVVAIGNAPTALLALLDLAAGGQVTPACVIGMPVGFVQAREAKERLRLSGLPYITIRGFRGGSALAAATVNALRELAEDDAAD